MRHHLVLRLLESSQQAYMAASPSYMPHSSRYVSSKQPRKRVLTIQHLSSLIIGPRSLSGAPKTPLRVARIQTYHRPHFITAPRIPHIHLHLRSNQNLPLLIASGSVHFLVRAICNAHLEVCDSTLDSHHHRPQNSVDTQVALM